MATTQKGIYYPDDYTAIADIPEDMKDLAESVDTALGDLEDNIEQNIQPQIDDIEEEQTTQNNNIEALQTENARLKATLPTTTGTGENITLQNTAELEFIQPPLPRGNSEQATSILPTGYTQLDYIESTGTQYIDTGITADDTVEFDVTFNTSNEISYYDYGTIFGCREAAVTKELQLSTYSDSQSGLSGTFRYGDSGSYTAYISKLTKENVKLQNKKYYVDGVEKLSLNKTFSNNFNIYIFALNQANAVSQYSRTKIYIFKLWKNGSLVRNFVPCKNASNEVGLYDLVSKTFFGNSGTGTFTAGNTVTVPNPDFEVPIQNVTGDVEVLVQNKNKWTGANLSDYTNIGVTTTFNNWNIGFQLEQGTTASTYTPHKEQTLPLTLGDIELCKIGTAQDYFYKDNGKWYLYKAINKVEITAENVDSLVTGQSVGYNINRVYINKTSLGWKNSWESGVALINNYSEAKTTSAIASGKFSLNNGSSTLEIYDDRFTDLATARQLMIGTIIYIVLATPTSTEITDTTLIEQLDAISQALSYEEQTNISGTSDESNPLFSVEAYQSIKLILAS